MGILRILIVILLVLVGALFSYFNPEKVGISYYFGSIEYYLSVLLLLALLVGILLGLMANLTTVLRVKAELRKVRKRTATLEQELTNLRALPIRD